MNNLEKGLHRLLEKNPGRIRSIGNEVTVSRVREQQALEGLLAKHIISAFQLTESNSQDDMNGVDCWIELPLAEERIPIQFKTGSDQAKIFRRKHPDIPVVRTRDGDNLTKKVEEIERSLIEEIISYRVKGIFSKLEIQVQRLQAMKHISPSANFRTEGIDGQSVCCFFYEKTSYRKRSKLRAGKEDSYLYFFMLGKEGWKSLFDIELDIGIKLGQRTVK